MELVRTSAFLEACAIYGLRARELLPNIKGVAFNFSSSCNKWVGGCAQGREEQGMLVGRRNGQEDHS